LTLNNITQSNVQKNIT